ncbi:hypothetical protein D3C73_1424280 [compost metagenome]
MNHNSVFIRGRLPCRTEPEMVQQLLPTVYAKHDIGIADIHGQHHDKPPSFFAFKSRLISRLAKE